MKNLNKAKDLDPLNVNVLLDLANAHLFDMDFTEAKRYAKGAMLLEPENALAKKVFVKICQLEKDFEKGKK